MNIEARSIPDACVDIDGFLAYPVAELFGELLIPGATENALGRITKSGIGISNTAEALDLSGTVIVVCPCNSETTYRNGVIAAVRGKLNHLGNGQLVEEFVPKLLVVVNILKHNRLVVFGARNGSFALRDGVGTLIGIFHLVRSRIINGRSRICA